MERGGGGESTPAQELVQLLPRVEELTQSKGVAMEGLARFSGRTQIREYIGSTNWTWWLFFFFKTTQSPGKEGGSGTERRWGRKWAWWNHIAQHSYITTKRWEGRREGESAKLACHFKEQTAAQDETDALQERWAVWEILLDCCVLRADGIDRCSFQIGWWKISIIWISAHLREQPCPSD